MARPENELKREAGEGVERHGTARHEYAERPSRAGGKRVRAHLDAVARHGEHRVYLGAVAARAATDRDVESPKLVGGRDGNRAEHSDEWCAVPEVSLEASIEDRGVLDGNRVPPESHEEYGTLRLLRLEQGRCCEDTSGEEVERCGTHALVSRRKVRYE